MIQLTIVFCLLFRYNGTVIQSSSEHCIRNYYKILYKETPKSGYNLSNEKVCKYLLSSFVIDNRVDPPEEVVTVEAAVPVVATVARGEDNTRRREPFSKILVSFTF